MDCLQSISQVLPDADKSEIKAILKELERERSKYFKETDGPTTQGFYDRAVNFLKERRYELLSARKEAIFNLQKQRKIIEIVSQDAFKNDPWEGLRSYMAAGEARLNKGANASPELMKGALKERWMTSLVSAVKENSFERAAASGELDRELAIEIFALQPDGKPGQTGIAPVIKLAQQIKAINSDIARTLQLSGSSMREMVGYITKQTHDPDAIRSVSFTDWAKKILPRLDIEKTFVDTSPLAVKEKLEDDYKNIISGRWSAPKINYTPDAYITVNGLAKNISDRTSRARAYQFKSPEDWVAYNAEFGKKTVVHAVLSAINEHAQNASIMHFFGTQPDAMFASVKEAIRKKFEGTPEVADKFDQKEAMLNKVYATARGVSDVPGHSTMAKIAGWARDLQVASKLGGAALSSIPGDIATAATNLNVFDGKNIFQHTLETMGEYASEFGSPSEKTQALLSLHKTAQEISGALLEGAASGPGRMSKLSTTLWRLSGMQRHTVVMKEVVANKVQRTLAELSKAEFGAIPERIRNDLQRYGIDQIDWNILKRAVEVSDDGTRYTTPEGVRAIDSAIVENELLKAKKISGDTQFYASRVEQYKFDLEVKLMSLIQDHAKAGATEPGVRQKALLLQGTTGDDGLGIMLRLMAQFKQVPLMALQETKRQMLSASGKDSVLGAMKTVSGNVALAQRVAALGIAGYIANTASDLAFGKAPKDPTDPKTAIDAFVRGGAFGLYSDFLLGAYDRDPGKMAFSMAAGPTLGQFYDTYELWNGLLKGEPKAGKAMGMVMNNMPFQNLFYTKGALNYFVLNGIREAASPGFLRRQEHTTESNAGLLDKHQEYLFYRPTESRRF